MEPYKEHIINKESPFPVDIFIQDNLKSHVTVEQHWHDCLELLYILEGTALQQINEKSFNVCKHDLVILREGDVHATYCKKSENTKILVIKFLPKLIDGSLSEIFESKYILAFLNNQGNQIHQINDMLQDSVAINSLMEGLFDEFVRKENGYEIFIKGYIYQLIACLIRSDVLNVHDNSYKQNDLKRLDKLFKHIEKHYNEGINLEEAAKTLNLSYSYLSRYFKRITGRTFKEYVDFVKICEAEKIILSKDISISQAAYEVGFCNVSSFNRVFKRVRGYAPGKIKRSKTAKE
jgi:AraC family transcriptional activator of pobA